MCSQNVDNFGEKTGKLARKLYIVCRCLPLAAIIGVSGLANHVFLTTGLCPAFDTTQLANTQNYIPTTCLPLQTFYRSYIQIFSPQIPPDFNQPLMSPNPGSTSPYKLGPWYTDTLHLYTYRSDERFHGKFKKHKI